MTDPPVSCYCADDLQLSQILSLSGVDGFCALENEILDLFNIFYAAKCVHLKISCHFFMLSEVISYFFLQEPNRHYMLKMYSDVYDG
jgi:uncharacterized membrane protein YpjA